MTTGIFGSMLSLTGLDENAAAYHLKVRPRAVRRWASQAEAPPPEVLRSLCRLMDEQQAVADEICTAWEDAGEPEQFAYGVSTDDESARELGWPSLDAQIRVLAIAQMTLPGVKIDTTPADKLGEEPEPQEELALAS